MGNVSEKLSAQLIDIRNNIEKAIIEEMKKNGLVMISFVLNGSTSDFDVDRAFAIVEDSCELIANQEIVAVCVVDNNLHILTDDTIDTSTMNVLDEKIFFYNKNEEDKKIIDELLDKENWLGSLDLFNPTDTLMDLLVSVEESVEMLNEWKNYTEKPPFENDIWE